MKKLLPLAALLLAMAAAQPSHVAQADDPGGYEIEPEGTPVRGHVWIGDGPAGVWGANATAGNRFRLGFELHLGDDYQFLLGWTALDLISSGETSDIGDIHRTGTGLDFGYFLIPDHLWIKYSLYLGAVKASAVGGYAADIGHALSVGDRFYTRRKWNLALELTYLYISSETSEVYGYSGQNFTTATYPHAGVLSLGLRVGFDIGGR